MENSYIRITLNKKAFVLRDEIRTWCETNLGEGQWIQKWKQGATYETINNNCRDPQHGI